MTYSTLISVADLIKHRQSDWVIVDCRFSLAEPELGESQYKQSHILGAFYAHLDHDLSSPINTTTGRHPLPDFKLLSDKLNSWGVSQSSQVIAYDDTGGVFASRLWWLLQACGHTGAAVLNGGLDAWQTLGGLMNNELPTTARPSAPYVLTPDANNWLEVSEVEANLTNKTFELIDARAADRYRGDAELIDAVAGHIPAALNVPVSDNLENDQFKSKEAIRDNFLKAVTKSQLVNSVHYCGSGVFACHNILSMAYAGLGKGRLYPGSWSEWIRDDERGKVGTHL